MSFRSTSFLVQRPGDAVPVLVDGRASGVTSSAMAELSVIEEAPSKLAWVWDQRAAQRMSKTQPAGVSSGSSAAAPPMINEDNEAGGAVLGSRSYRDAMLIASYLGNRAAGIPAARLVGTGVTFPVSTGAEVPGGRVVAVNGKRVRSAPDALREILSGSERARFDVDDGRSVTVARDEIIDRRHNQKRLVSIATADLEVRVPFRVFLPPYRELDTGDSSMLPQAMGVAVVARGWKMSVPAAAMGALDEFGAVFPVIGVRQKVIAAIDHKIRYIYVPAENLAEARRAARRDTRVRVIAVQSLNEALIDWTQRNQRMCTEPCWPARIR